MKKKNDKADVGSYIVTHCSKCNNDVNHVVVAKDGTGTVVKVKCIVCGSEHKPKKENSIHNVTNRRISTIKKTSRGSVSSNIRLWEQAKGQAINKSPISYKINDMYEKDMLIFHSKLGEGIILKSLENKIEVIFKDGIKLLVHGLK